MFKSIANNSKNDENILYLISILWMNISKKRKKQFWLLLILMIITSLLEVLSIGLVLPFLGILANPEEVHKVEYCSHLWPYSKIITLIKYRYL